MNEIPSDPDALVTRKRGADALSTEGFPTSAQTLATKACRGGGPPYQLYGKVALYRWGDLLDWAKASMRQPRRSTSELDSPRALNGPGRPPKAEPIEREELRQAGGAHG